MSILIRFPLQSFLPHLLASHRFIISFSAYIASHKWIQSVYRYVVGYCALNSWHVFGMALDYVANDITTLIVWNVINIIKNKT